MTWLSKLLGREERVPMSNGTGGSVSGFEVVDRVVLPASIAEATQQSLRFAGHGGNEGLVVWSGTQDGTVFVVKTLTTPTQRGIRSSDGVCVIVDGDVLHQLNVATYRRGERMFAQVHSHPGRAYHSLMDDRYAVITSAGGLSLVVPDFAVRPFSVAECAVFRLTRKGTWKEVPRHEAGTLITMSET